VRRTLGTSAGDDRRCETQAELDDLWAKLGAGGQEQQCGWLKDRFGLSWQVVPAVLGELMTDPDPARSAWAGIPIASRRYHPVPAR